MTSTKTRSRTEPLASWALRRIRLEGRPFSFTGHEYLKDLYDETSRHVVVMKGAQVGGTTWGILESIHACASGRHTMYFFPTKSDVLEFSKARISPLLADNPFLLRLMEETDTAGLKKIGPAYLYLRGMQSTVGMKSVPADMVVFDELDEATPEAKALALERLSHSDYGRVIELSNPSLPDYGIDAAFKLTDQRHWTLKCPACGAWTAPDMEFPEKLGQEVKIILPRPDGTFYRACPKCAAELDLAAGEWVPLFPTQSDHGSRISQLVSSKVDPGDILREYQTTHFPQQFFNLKIGVAWADLEHRLDAATVLSLCTDVPMRERSQRACSMGVDTGKRLHVVILREDLEGPEQHLIHLGVYSAFSELDALMDRFHVRHCVIDGMPEGHLAREFAARHRGKVWLNYFNEHQRGAPKWDDVERMVRVNRTEALDASRSAIRDKQLVLPRREPIVDLFAHHMTADAKKLDEDPETGALKYRYIKTGENHLGFAFAYAWLAATGKIAHRGLMTWMRKEVMNLRRERGETVQDPDE